MDQERLDAKARGEKVYDGAPCVNGHGTTRYVSTGGCMECGRISALAAYHKRRAKLNQTVVTYIPEKIETDTNFVVGYVVERVEE